MPDPIKLVQYALAGWLPGGKRICVFCKHRVWRFMPYRSGSRGIPPLMSALDCIGSDVDQFECPRCGAHDRERHLLMYMRATGLLNRLTGMRIVHFAPERRLSLVIVETKPVQYIRCDLHPSSEEISKVNIEAMPFADCSFDLLIANHVLEHLHDYLQAVKEIVRVLDIGGCAILQTPYSAMLESTWSDVGITNDEARSQAYGQEDHLRLFGRDIFERIASQGLEACISTHAELMPEYQPAIYGVNPREPFFFFYRKT